MVNVTEDAINKIKQSRIDEKLPEDHMMRILVITGGCSGFRYKLDFTDQKNENDKLLECDGVSVIIDHKSYLYIIGMTLDYEGGLNGKGFVFTNPNATKTCSCGVSFGV